MKSSGALKESGMRVTNQRDLIMGIIREGQGHLDADEIYRRAREKEPRLGLSTVYRTLQTFKKLGLVEELHFDENHHHYEKKPVSEHHHLVCLGCGRIIEFRYPLVHHIGRDIPESKGFNITGTEIRITGYCSKCSQQ